MYSFHFHIPIKDNRNIAEHNRWFQAHIYFYLRTALPGFDRHFGVGDSGYGNFSVFL